MKIALDYDGTYTADPAFWDKFMIDCKAYGHEVIVVTMRRPEEIVSFSDRLIVYTSRRAKKQYCENAGISIDIWIDDNPRWVFQDYL
jgi:hypothetical protein